MFKMMKYEFRKSRVPMTVLATIFGLLELAFLFMICFMPIESLQRDDFWGASFAIDTSLLVIMGIVTYLYIFVHSIAMYENDLKNKTGYLTFMAPISTWAVLGSKLLYSFFEGIIFTVCYSLLGVLDMIIVLKKLGASLNEIGDAFARFIAGIFLQAINPGDYHIDFTAIAFILISVLVAYYLLITLSYLAVSVVNAVAREKSSGVKFFCCLAFYIAAFALVVAIDSAFDRVFGTCNIDLITSDPAGNGKNIIIGIFEQVRLGVVCILSYIGSVKLLQKRVNL